jgi:hypothetical protein
MEIIELENSDLKLPDWIVWLQWINNQVFIRWDKIEAWCGFSWWKVITLTKNSVDEIIDLKCNALSNTCNKCTNKQVDSDICLINIKKTP